MLVFSRVTKYAVFMLTRAVERLAVVVLILGMCHGAGAQSKAGISPETLYSHNKGSVVTILTFDSKKAALGQGSGFVVAKNRIVTNYHVLAGSSAASIIFNDGVVVTANRVVAASEPKDIVVVDAATGDRPPLSLGDELQLKVGQTVYAIGAPQGLSASLSNGLVSAFREDEGQFLIQITASISPGSSGGPLFDSQGLVVGITTSRLKDGSFGFAVGAGDLQHLLKAPLSIPLELSDLTEDTSSSNDDLADVKALFTKEKYPDALGAFQKASDSAKKSFDGQLLLCKIENQVPDYSVALRACDAAIAIQPGDGQPYGLKAYALLFSGDYGEAEVNAVKATQMMGNSEFGALLGLIYYFEEKYSLVPKHLPSDSGDPFELTLLEGAARRTGDSESYKKFNAKMVSLKGADNGWSLFNSGLAAEKDLKFDQALADYRKCDADSDFVDPICAVQIASVETRQGDYRSAKSDISSALQRYSGSRGVRSEAIFIDLLVGDVDEAKRLHGSIEASSSQPQDDSSECLYFYAINQPGLAVDPCNAMLGNNKTSNTAWSNAGYVALDLGQFQLAGSYFAKAWDLYNASSDKHTVAQELDLMWGLTLANYFNGDKKDAKALYRAIKKSYPDLATMSALKQLPLIWSDGTQTLINKVIADFK